MVFAYIDKWIRLECSIGEEGNTHQEGRQREAKWHVLDAFRFDHQLLQTTK